jgi:hypothetical protein
MYYIGLDVHKRTISYCVKNVSGAHYRIAILLARQMVQMKNRLTQCQRGRAHRCPLDVMTRPDSRRPEETFRATLR